MNGEIINNSISEKEIASIWKFYNRADFDEKFNNLFKNPVFENYINNI